MIKKGKKFNFIKNFHAKFKFFLLFLVNFTLVLPNLTQFYFDNFSIS